jgi:GNAT superfamily N-acetyltransferase
MGWVVRRIDRALMQEPGIRNPSNALNRYAVDKMNSNWGSIEAFLEKGFGFCTLHDDEVLCWCIADCASGDACEIGVRTRPDMRRRGLATLTAAATVDHALSHRFSQVGWHCWEGNAGSIGVAEKVGFELERRYVACVRMFDEAYHLAETGLARFMAGRYEEATRCYEQAFALGTSPFPHPYYHMAARSWAAQGNRGKALHYLDLAIAQGEDRLEYTKGCPEFAILHSGTEWKAVLARIEAAVQKDTRRDSMSYRLDNNDDEWVRAMMGTGCLAAIGTEGRTTDGADQSRKHRQIMVHP